MLCRFEEPTAEEGAYRADSAPSGESLHSYRSSEDGDHAGAEDTGRSAPNAEKKMRFADRRKDHYNMRSALKEYASYTLFHVLYDFAYSTSDVFLLYKCVAGCV